jgi:hypothetical protein
MLYTPLLVAGAGVASARVALDASRLVLKLAMG